MFTQNQRGFTIVELLIVIVVIAILAAITIVSYNGISQRAIETSVSSAAVDWSKLIQTSNIKNNFKFPDGSVSCLGQSAADFPAANGFAAGVCVMQDGVAAVPYNSSAYVDWPSDQPRPSGLLPVTQLTTSGSVLKARGSWISSTSASSVTFRWISVKDSQCGGGGVFSDQSSTGGTLCAKSVLY